MAARSAAAGAASGRGQVVGDASGCAGDDAIAVCTDGARGSGTGGGSAASAGGPDGAADGAGSGNAAAAGRAVTVGPGWDSVSAGALPIAAG
jgi:hypothetical protein